MIYGYARVSTKKQLEGNGLEVQEKAMLAAGADMVIKEQYTGTTMQRPRLDALLEHIPQVEYMKKMGFLSMIQKKAILLKKYILILFLYMIQMVS